MFLRLNSSTEASSLRALWPPSPPVHVLGPVLAPSPHLPGVVFLLSPHWEDQHLERGQPQGPSWERTGEGKLLILAPTRRAAAASSLGRKQAGV